MIELREDILGELVKSKDKVVVQFGADWCGNCRLVKPKFRQLSEEHPEILFVSADAEKYPKSRMQAELNYLPTFVGYAGGKKITQKAGYKVETIKEVIHALANH